MKSVQMMWEWLEENQQNNDLLSFTYLKPSLILWETLQDTSLSTVQFKLTKSILTKAVFLAEVFWSV